VPNASCRLCQNVVDRENVIAPAPTAALAQEQFNRARAPHAFMWPKLESHGPKARGSPARIVGSAGNVQSGT